MCGWRRPRSPGRTRGWQCPSCCGRRRCPRSRCSASSSDRGRRAHLRVHGVPDPVEDDLARDGRIRVVLQRNVVEAELVLLARAQHEGEFVGGLLLDAEGGLDVDVGARDAQRLARDHNVGLRAPPVDGKLDPVGLAHGAVGRRKACRRQRPVLGRGGNRRRGDNDGGQKQAGENTRGWHSQHGRTPRRHRGHRTYRSYRWKPGTHARRGAQICTVRHRIGVCGRLVAGPWTGPVCWNTP